MYWRHGYYTYAYTNVCTDPNAHAYTYTPYTNSDCNASALKQKQNYCIFVLNKTNCLGTNTLITQSCSYATNTIW